MIKKKPTKNRRLMLIAERLRSAFEKRAVGACGQVIECFPELMGYWDNLRRAKRDLLGAKIKPTAEGMRDAQRLLRRLRGHVSGVRQCSGFIVQRIDSCSARLGTGRSKLGLPTLNDCYDQLDAMDREFGTCELSHDKRSIIVVSHEVKLQNILFGRYRIRIQLDRIETDHRSFYFVNPVSDECPKVDGSSHPNMRNEHLCEGAGGEAMTKAFTEGRLYDCVILINNILQTYGSESPYVELVRFEGPSEAEEETRCCSNCSDQINEEDLYGCYACGDSVCPGCVHYCSVTGQHFCTECVEHAQETDAPCSSRCSSIGHSNCEVRTNDPCPECNAVFPDSLLAKCEIIQDEAQLCNGCAKVWATARTPCDSCLMHGYLGCALVKHGYPMLNSLNHPASVTAVVKQHEHHSFGRHSIGLFHSAQTCGDARADFRAYQQFLNRMNGRDRTRFTTAEETMTNQQREQLMLTLEED